MLKVRNENRISLHIVYFIRGVLDAHAKYLNQAILLPTVKSIKKFIKQSFVNTFFKIILFLSGNNYVVKFNDKKESDKVIPLFLFLILLLFIGCDNPISSKLQNYKCELCYVKLINNNWEVVLYSNGFTKNISNNPKSDDMPSCSPNGNYIAWTYYNPIGGTDIYLYDIYKDSSYNITPGTEYSADSPIWLNNSKIIYNYQKLGAIDDSGENGTYIIDIENGNNKQILNKVGKIFFCNNEIDFFYNLDGIIYKTNINGDYKEAILDLETIGKNYTNIYDFDPIREKLLILIAQTPQITNILAEYDVNTKTIDTISTAETGYVYLYPKYSNDHSKIAALSRNYDSDISKIILLKGGNKKELVILQSDKEWLHLYKNIFSSDDQKIIYSKNIQMDGEAFYWYSDLYLFNLSNNQNTFIDRGMNPVWITK
jgi:hypothetical protein